MELISAKKDSQMYNYLQKMVTDVDEMMEEIKKSSVYEDQSETASRNQGS